MWLIVGLIGGVAGGWVARPFSGLKAGLICMIPMVVWWLALLGILGPGGSEATWSQFAVALLGIMVGITVPRLLDRRPHRTDDRAAAQD